MKKYKILLLDADDTLLDFQKAEYYGLRKTFENHHIQCDEELMKRYNLFNDSLWKKAERKEITLEELKKIRFVQFFKQEGIEEDGTTIEAEYRNEIYHSYYLMDNVKECLEKLSSVCDLYVASNGFIDMQQNRLKQAGIDSYFKKIYVSDAIGATKPSPLFFQHIFEDLQITDKEEVLMIGDSLTSDILGGIQSGIDTVWLHKNHENTDSEIRPTYHYSDLKEFTDEYMSSYTKEIISHSADETKAFAQNLASYLSEGTLILLTGDLGAGKTTFTQGLAKGLHITKNVTSPTFTIMKVYQGDLPLYHIDAYRLEGMTQDLGFEELLEDDGICVIEWPMFIESILPSEYLQIEITRLDENQRKLVLIAHGERYRKLLEELL